MSIIIVARLHVWQQDMLIKNARNRARKWTAERMDALGKAVSMPLGDIIRQYKYQLPILHPFEATLADLTVRAREKSGERTLQVRITRVGVCSHHIQLPTRMSCVEWIVSVEAAKATDKL